MKSEELRHRIKLQKNTVQTDDNGFETETWTDFKELWAAVTNLHGKEYFEAAAVQAEKTVKFTVRFFKDITESMRISFDGKQYNIIAIDNIKYANKFIEIKAMEVGNSG